MSKPGRVPEAVARTPRLASATLCGPEKTSSSSTHGSAPCAVSSIVMRTNLASTGSKRSTFRRALLGRKGGIALDLVVGPGDEVAGRRVLAAGVAGQLVADELVVRSVVVEGPDDVIAVRPGVGPGGVGLEAGRLGEADHVEPVPG